MTTTAPARRPPRNALGATGVAAVLAVLGIAVLVMAAYLSIESMKAGRFDCGSVLSPKDPRNTVSRRVQVPLLVTGAALKCIDLRHDRGQTASVLLASGSGVLVLALAAPSIQRSLRRMHRRRRNSAAA